MQFYFSVSNQHDELTFMQKKFTICTSFLCQNLQQFLLAKKRLRNWSVLCARSALISAKKLFEFGRWRCPLGAATGKFLEFWYTMHSECHFLGQILATFQSILNKFEKKILRPRYLSFEKFSKMKITIEFLCDNSSIKLNFLRKKNFFLSST